MLASIVTSTVEVLTGSFGETDDLDFVAIDLDNVSVPLIECLSIHFFLLIAIEVAIPAIRRQDLDTLLEGEGVSNEKLTFL